MNRFEDRVVLVTGAASGIGRATVERLASEGAKLFCVDVQPDELELTVKSAVELGAEAQSHLCDVSDPGQVADTVAACIDRFGRLDVLCHVAGILRLAHTHELALEEWQKVIDVNLTGTLLICQAALPHLIESGGCIVNTASTAALSGMPWGAAYGASKAGVLALTRTIAVEYAKRGVRANAVCPGSIQTAMTSRSALPEGFDPKLLQRVMPLDQPRGPEAVASVIAMLASEDGAHINGEFVRIDGGTLA